jgi:hypothetical protein
MVCKRVERGRPGGAHVPERDLLESSRARWQSENPQAAPMGSHFLVPAYCLWVVLSKPNGDDGACALQFICQFDHDITSGL